MSEKIKRKRALNVPALAGIWYTASSFLERGSAIIFTPIYTRLLSPEEYGVYSVYNGFLGIVSVFATLEISGGQVVHAAFGKGEILSARPMGNDVLYEVAFEQVGTKKLMGAYAKLKVAE